jgi:hypothetical protein
MFLKLQKISNNINIFFEANRKKIFTEFIQKLETQYSNKVAITESLQNFITLLAKIKVISFHSKTLT